MPSWIAFWNEWVSTMASKVNNFPFWEVIGKAKKWWRTYLYRLHLTPQANWKGRRYYLHIFFRPDADRDFHDHPWGFETTVLFGGYDEISRIMDEKVQWPVPTGSTIQDKLGFLSRRYRKATHAHRITRLHTWFVITLVARDNTRSREWGFWTKNEDDWDAWKWVRWQDYVGNPERPSEAY